MSKSTIRNIIIAVIFVLFAAVIFGVMTYQVVSNGSKLSGQIATLEEERAQEASFIRLQKIALDSLEDREKLAGHYLLKEGDSIDFLNRVENSAVDSGVQLKTESLEEIIDPKDDSKWIQMTFSVGGSRETVQKFIRVIETLPYVLSINKISMSARSSSNWDANIEVKVRVMEYDE